MKHSIYLALSSALVTALAISAAPVFAQTHAGEVQTHASVVSTADLDLGTSAGQRRLQQRLARAARDVCGTASDADLEGKNLVRKCRDEAIARAASQRFAVMAASERGAVITIAARP